MTSGIAQVRALEQALASTQSQLDSTILGRDVGVRTSVDVLNAQQQVFQTRRDLQQARYNYLLNTLRLKAAAGTLAEADLEQVEPRARSRLAATARREPRPEALHGAAVRLREVRGAPAPCPRGARDRRASASAIATASRASRARSPAPSASAALRRALEVVACAARRSRAGRRAQASMRFCPP